jgi:hypothetical protein
VTKDAGGRTVSSTATGPEGNTTARSRKTTPQ